MCNLSQGIKEEGIAKGCAEEKVNSAKKYIKNLMKAEYITFDEAVDILGIEKEIVEIIRKEMTELENINETMYLSSNPKLKQDIIDGINTPLEDCIDEKEVNW